MSDELPPLNVEWTNVFKRDYFRQKQQLANT